MKGLHAFRMLLSSLYAAPLSAHASSQAVNTTAASNASSQCRCLSSDPSCWPTQDAFEDLAKQVSQPLLYPAPPASVCYPENFEAAECTIATSSWTNGTWRSDQPGAMQNPNYEAFYAQNGTIEACYLNTTLGFPCSQGSVAPIGVDARSVADIQATIGFATKHNLRLAVKNTGHDYMGRSTARGAFLLWTHHLKNITYHDTFSPDGAPSSAQLNDVLTIGSGIQWAEAYNAAFARSRQLVGGASPGGSVGAAGGWLQGGGHSALAPTYGLGVDNVVQFTVVTANGSYVAANEYQHSDLFWALRGGGGGTWGVVVSVSYQTHASTPVIAASFTSTVNWTSPNATTTASPVLRTLFTEFMRMTPAMADGGWAGYLEILPSGATEQPAMQFAYIAPNVSWADANTTMNPFFELAASLAANSTAEDGGALNITALVNTQVPSFAAWETALFGNKTGEVGTNVELSSRLLPDELIRNDPDLVADTLLSLTYTAFYRVAGGAVAEKDPDSTGLNPAWRKALAHVIYGANWAFGSSAAVVEQARDTVKHAESVLQDLAPDSGAYINEASMYTADFKATFFGAHYDKLRAIKKVYDPLDLFIVHSGVASDEWDADLNCRV